MTFCRSDEKYKILKKHLDLDEFLLVHLIPYFEGVIVPEKYAEQSSLTLKLSYYFRGNLELTEDLITTELRFDGNYFTCSVPLDAVWGCTTLANKNFLWPENIPPESLGSITSELNGMKELFKSLEKTSPMNKPTVIEGKKDSKKKGKERKKPSLKRIK